MLFLLVVARLRRPLARRPHLRDEALRQLAGLPFEAVAAGDLDDPRDPGREALAEALLLDLAVDAQRPGALELRQLGRHGELGG